nr:MAG TPA: hypothetical protein [Caudoviricetes sp.]
MKLQGISISVVRNEYEYNKHVSEEYRRQYDYEASKSSLPWIIIDFAKYNTLEDFVSNSELTFSPVADFTEISWAGNGEWSVGSDKTKLTVNLQKMNRLMLEAKKDVGYASLPANFSVTVKDKQGDIFTDEHASIDLSDTAKILKSIDEQCLQQGGGYLAELFYELIAQGKV